MSLLHSIAKGISVFTLMLCNLSCTNSRSYEVNPYRCAYNKYEAALVKYITPCSKPFYTRTERPWRLVYLSEKEKQTYITNREKYINQINSNVADCSGLPILYDIRVVKKGTRLEINDLKTKGPNFTTSLISVYFDGVLTINSDAEYNYYFNNSMFLDKTPTDPKRAAEVKKEAKDIWEFMDYFYTRCGSD